MKIKRYQAPDMRTALRWIRESQGPDAVILSSKSVPGGVEVCAAADMESVLAADSLAEAEPAAAADAAAMPPYGRLSPGNARFGGAPADLGQELHRLRQLLEQQLAALAWNDYTRREPQRAVALAELATLGVSREVAESIAASMPAAATDSTQPAHLTLLARRISCCSPPWEQGGVHALIGPAGAGKTTVIAKLASRWVLEHGRDSVALIAADDERPGAAEQLRSLGRVLGVETHAVIGAREFDARASALSGRSLILVDTPGLAPDDDDTLQLLRAMRELRTDLGLTVVLPASSQCGVIEATLERVRDLQAECALLSRADEATSLGGVLSALIRTRLPLAAVSSGGRIPGELLPARAQLLVARACELAHAVAADEELLARRHGGLTHAAA